MVSIAGVRVVEFGCYSAVALWQMTVSEGGAGRCPAGWNVLLLSGVRSGDHYVGNLHVNIDNVWFIPT